MSTIVEIEQGKLEGLKEDGLFVFRGVSYAKPPVGALRFRAPQKPESWSGIRRAHAFAPSAWQPPGVLQTPSKNSANSEDCLYLNIWTPGLDSNKRPVMVWIHGGAFLTGTGSEPLYDSHKLAALGDIVAITINYRLGPLGFAYFEQVNNPDFKSDANNGVRDQIAALQWIQTNIERFGGDPNNVTIFGESAGGMSVSCLLASPAAQGLFHKAIAQSGSANVVMPLQDAKRVSETFMQVHGLDENNLQRLYEISPKDLFKAMPACLKVRIRALFGGSYLPIVGMPFCPVGDGEILPSDPLKTVGEGSAKSIPLMIGTCRDEWRFFTFLVDARGKEMDEIGLNKLCKRRIGDKGEEVLERYRRIRSTFANCSPPDLFAAIETDRFFRIPAIRLAEVQSGLQQKTYMYLFDWPSPTENGILGACHAIDIPFVLGTGDSEIGRLLTGGASNVDAFSDVIRSTWVAFARSGDPNNDKLPIWPQYTSRNRSTMILSTRSRVEDAPLDAERTIWDDIF